MQYYLNVMMILLTIVMMVPLTGIKLTTTEIGIPVNLDKGDNLGIFELREILDEATNFTRKSKVETEHNQI